MAITVPSVDTEISVAAFGAPVVNALNAIRITTVNTNNGQALTGTIANISPALTVATTGIAIVILAPDFNAAGTTTMFQVLYDVVRNSTAIETGYYSSPGAVGTVSLTKVGVVSVTAGDVFYLRARNGSNNTMTNNTNSTGTLTIVTLPSM